MTRVGLEDSDAWLRSLAFPLLSFQVVMVVPVAGSMAVRSAASSHRATEGNIVG